MPAEYHQPTITENAFNCPHCGAFSNQKWGEVHYRGIWHDGLPDIVYDLASKGMVALNKSSVAEQAQAKELQEKLARKEVFIGEGSTSTYRSPVHNLHLAECARCKQVSVWRHADLIWPVTSTAVEPNEDLPDSARQDYLEAAAILNMSPRGAAALLRLAVQKLCLELGGKGKSIDTDIAALVANGLDQRVQQALDVVRVVGNNAVHPGEIDIRDDRETAGRLFGLVNLIADIMITQKKQLDAMFRSLPSGALAAIEKRDKKG